MYSRIVDEYQAGPTTRQRYDPISMIFHWMTLLLLAGIFAGAWARGAAQDGKQAALLLD